MSITYGAGSSGKKRPGNRPTGRDLDRMVFGPPQDEDADLDEPPARVRTRRPREEEDELPYARHGRDFSRLPGETGAYPRAEENRRGPIILLAAGAVVAIFALVVWNAYRDGVRPEGGEAAPQLADAGPFKSRPDPKQAPVDPAMEASVFESVEPTAEPAGAEPVVPEDGQGADAAPAGDPAAAAAPSASEVRPDPMAAPAAAPPARPVQPAAIGPVQTAATSAPPPAASAPAPVPAPPPAPPAIRSAPSGDPAFSPGGRYVVQLGAPSTEAAALAEWERRRRAMPELLGGAERFIVRADVNGRTVFRVRAGSFATAAEADAFCGRIKARGGDCFRTEK